ncbi:MAG: ribonuclease III [Spirochaetales bacterium]
MLNKTQISEIEKKLNYSFKNKELLSTAFTHSSYGHLMNEAHNERLEFLGDSVLQLCVTKYLYTHFDLEEGALSKIRSFIVSTKNLSKAVNDLDFISFLQYAQSGNKVMSNAIKADLFEAVLGAIYLDSNFETTYNFVVQKLKFTKELFADLMQDAKDYKTTLQELIQTKKDNVLEYRIIKKEGPAHLPKFTAQVLINGTVLGEAEGRSKKEAENICASIAIKKLDL